MKTTEVFVLSRFSRVQLFESPWSAACQAPLCMGFARHGCWCGLPCPALGDLPDPVIESESLASPALVGRFFTTSATSEATGMFVRLLFINENSLACFSVLITSDNNINNLLTILSTFSKNVYI